MASGCAETAGGVDARARLARCLDVFQALEAGPWVARARRNSWPAGVRSAPLPAHRCPRRSPQELQIAELVAGGPRNREIAGNLFLSLRTVEVHLSRVFRKLEISSRTQLVARMGD